MLNIHNTPYIETIFFDINQLYKENLKLNSNSLIQKIHAIQNDYLEHTIIIITV